MSDPGVDNKLISEDKAKELAAHYLHERYFDFEKVSFNSVEMVTIQENPVYRIYGTVRVKSRSLLDRLIIDKKAYTYKFMVDMNALTGRVISYEFQ